jgi:phospholipase/carboxylesterase
MGGAMTAAAILTMPEQVRGGLILSGYLPIHSNLEFKPEKAAGHPVFEAHGTLDRVLPIELGRMTRDYFAKTPVDLTYREYAIAHEVSTEELAGAREWMRRDL